MGNYAAGKQNETRTLLALASALVLAATLIASALLAQSPKAQAPAVQPPTPQWQIDAGGKMEFDVASVKRDTAPPSPATRTANMPLGPQGAFTPTGGLFSVNNRTLEEYVLFAYRLTPEQDRSFEQQQEPKWAQDNRYDIQARASGNPNKDQFRLMVQALLADRFKLAVHYETKQVPVFALLLDKPGKLGPKIQPHPSDASCSIAIPPGGASAITGGTPATIAGGFPERCGAVARWTTDNPPGRFRIGARNVPIAMLSDWLGNYPIGIDRPVLDKTGLEGTYDFIIEFTPQLGPQPPGATFQPDPNGPTFQEALKEQLGLKLESQTGPTEVFVLDHVEQPSEN
jgi:uncharacterized protein (TIGR03435 family)